MKKSTLLGAALLPVAAFAHAGHGQVENGLAHYLTSPIHLLGILAAVALVGVAYRALTKKNHA